MVDVDYSTISMGNAKGSALADSTSPCHACAVVPKIIPVPSKLVLAEGEKGGTARWFNIEGSKQVPLHTASALMRCRDDLNLLSDDTRRLPGASRRQPRWQFSVRRVLPRATPTMLAGSAIREQVGARAMRAPGHLVPCFGTMHLMMQGEEEAQLVRDVTSLKFTPADPAVRVPVA